MTPPVLPPAPFGRVLTAMVTPFDEHGEVDLDGCARVATHLADHGHDGIVVSGTTGEAPTTGHEGGRVLEAVIDAVGERCQVVAGVGTNDTAHSVAFMRRAEKAGADGALVVSPYYSKPTQEGICRHVEAIADAASLPVMLYDIPGRTAVSLSEDTLARLAERDQVVAVKDAVGDLARGVRVMQRTGLAYYSGDDAMNLAWLTHGACGIVSVVGHVAGDAYAEMVQAVDAGDLARARRLYTDLVPLVDAVMGTWPGAMTAKAGLQLLGVLGNRRMRLPLVDLDEDGVGVLRAALTDAGLLEDAS